MGKDFLNGFVKNTKQYVDETDTNKQDEMQKGEYVGWTAREIWFADDKSDNSVLYGNKSVPRGHYGSS
jgi:uncharacterized protein YhjY with autotransporter beta-barrel domain